MPRQVKRRSYARLPIMLMLGVVAFPIMEVVGASSLPDNLLGLQEQLITAKKVAPIEDDGSVTAAKGSNVSENMALEALHKSDKIRTARFLPRPDFPEGPPLMDRLEPPFPGRGPGFLEGPPPNFAPRKGCLEDINRQMAIYGYTKSKLQLTDSQKAAWKAIEDALDSAIGKLRGVCQMLPNEVVGPPGILERSDFLEKQLSARLDLVRALRAPMQELLLQLSPDQRASLDAPPPLPLF